MKTEHILIPAIHVPNGKTMEHLPVNIKTGTVLCAYGHYIAVLGYFDITGKVLKSEEYVQGFLTNENKFVDIAQAMVIAIKAGQVDRENAGRLLISQMLY